MFTTVTCLTRNLSVFDAAYLDTTMISNDASQNLLEQVSNAVSKKSPLVITAGRSKDFYGNHIEGEPVSTIEHTGIIDYQPSELVVTVRSGTRLNELEAALKNNNQMLAFEPPSHTEHTTIGGVIACGLSGPRRTACGSARDFVLGTSIINGRAEKLKFGGQVMKNVAGYDASRLMVGAQGTLGMILDVSLKVLPLNESEITIKINTNPEHAIQYIRQWVKQGIPVTASCFIDNTLYLRLGSTHSAVKNSLATINKQFSSEETSTDFWLSIKNQTHKFFTEKETGSPQLWRCSQQAATDFYGNTKNDLIEWNGALRWVYSDKNLHTITAGYGGHATRYPIHSDRNNKDTNDIFQPLEPALLKIHKNLKQAFDPGSILNPGRLYSDL